MAKPLYFLILIFILSANTGINAEEVCSTELFPDEYVSKLFWQEEGNSFVVGLGQPGANEYTYDYKLIRFDDQGIDISDYEIIDDSLISNVVSTLGISERFYDSYDSTNLFLSLDYQSALYLQDNQLNIFNIETGTSDAVILPSPLGEIEQVSWIDNETILFVATHPYGVGYEIIKSCLHRNCLTYLTDPIIEPIGAPAISNDKHFAIAPSVAEPDTVFLIDLAQDNENAYQEVQISFFFQTDVSPIWSDDGNEFYVIGSEVTTSDVINSIYKLTFEGETLVEETQVVELDNDLAYSTSLWLVDPINQLSIHALRYGGLKILCWD